MNPPDLEQVRRAATQAHEGQRYGERPYTAHLADVVAVLGQFGFVDPVILASGWLHDAVEDTPMTLDEVVKVAGAGVAAIVDAVTDGEGESRKIRKARPYQLIPTVPGSLAVKLADRIANVTSARQHRPGLMRMYRREQPHFRAALHSGGHLETMWAHLESLFEEKSL